ncbi:MAG: anaerobic ribonucleoside-triphosphate reductase [Lachnospiraceae bacterium]|nr:anaerobic ribonucleoside-triphosphate reductase [Lachnospiraceae bacterium]
MEVIEKRDGSLVPYNKEKIISAIRKANLEVPDEAERISEYGEASISTIIKTLEERLGTEDRGHRASVDEIQDLIEESLMTINRGNGKIGYTKLAKKYMLYRATRALIRNANTTDEAILSLVANQNEEVSRENSNKNSKIASTQRDLIAGEVSKDLTKRILLPSKISKAHEDGILHFHDADYFLQPIFNCCLVNIKDMLDNGTVMNGKMIESPKSFQVACTVTTQIISSIASGQYGGQSVNLKHLGKYLRISIEKYTKVYKEMGYSGKELENLVNDRVKSELASGVQTIQYQINTIMTTNGQTPFVTLFMEIEEGSPYEEEQAMIYEEVLKQRYQGIKNEKGVYITPPFPKLIYVLDEHNCLKGGKYDYLTELAVKCSSKRMYPDYISAKKMRELHNGEVFSCMGCRSFLSEWKDENGKYKWEGRFNQGVVSLNLPQIAILSTEEKMIQDENGVWNPVRIPDELKFYQLLEERLALCFEALLCRHRALLGTPSEISPIHFQHGAIARLKTGEKIDKLLKDGYSTLSLGYIGLYETTKLMTGKSHTTEEGHSFAVKLMKKLRSTCDKWKEDTGLGFGLYGTPAESLCYRFARIDREKFGSIPDVTDKGYYTNSYHVDVREKVDAFTKLKFESEFQEISSGGAISYVEIPNMSKNIDALKEVVKFIYENIQYAEFNTKSDYCMNCGFDGEIIINDDNEWECPQCGNKDHSKMNVTRRTCGYLGENFWNVGKTKEIKSRVLHL